MKIVNIEKLDGHKTIVLTGRDKHVRAVAKHLQARLYYVPRETDYFEDYPLVVNELKELLENTHTDGIVIITSQSAEFLDCLLRSDLDFAMVTVRHFDIDDEDTCRLRVTTKEYAWENRCAFNYELR